MFGQAAFFNNEDAYCLFGISTLHKIHLVWNNSTNVLKSQSHVNKYAFHKSCS